MKLYTYFRSSAAYRVRVVLNLKNVDYELAPVQLRAAEQRSDVYLAVNPQGLVPALEDAGQFLTQSLAIIEYLDEKFPEPRLIPGDAVGRAHIRSLAQLVACEMHPLNNLRVLNYLRDSLHCDDGTVDKWYRHWIAEGFRPLEAIIRDSSGAGFCVGEAPTLADVCLAPQVFNARRFNCDMSAYPNVVRVYEHLMTLPAFQRAAPENQPDAT